MRRRVRRGVLFLVAGFVVLFSLRLAYGFWSYPDDPANVPVGVTDEFQLERKNYASEKRARKNVPGAAATFDQKYERVADASLRSYHFTDDEAALRATVQTYEGLVQAEQKSGLEPVRSLRLVVGVDPSRFDEMVAALDGVGTPTRLDLRKTDKTNDYHQLQASRRSLEKSKTALIGLKDGGGRLSEQIQLEEKILETEKQIQAMGVQLGEFDEENEFCTVKVTLVEQAGEVAAGPSWPQRIKVAFEWTTIRYLLLLISLAMGSFFVLMFLLIADKLGAIRTLVRATLDPERPAGSTG